MKVSKIIFNEKECEVPTEELQFFLDKGAKEVKEVKEIQTKTKNK